MIDSLKNFWKNGLNFEGRTTRSEYWYAILGMILVTIFAIMILTALDNFMFIIFIYGLLIISYIPNLAITTRRLHDVNKSGMLLFWSYIPIIGYFFTFYVFYLTCCKSYDYDNKYGKKHYSDYDNVYNVNDPELKL